MAEPVPIIMVERFGAIYELHAGGAWYLDGTPVLDPEELKTLNAVAGAASVALARGMTEE